MIYLMPGFKANGILKWVRADKEKRAAVMMPACSDDGFMAKRRSTVMTAARSKDVVVWGAADKVVSFKTWAEQKGVEFKVDW